MEGSGSSGVPVAKVSLSFLNIFESGSAPVCSFEAFAVVWNTDFRSSWYC